MIEPQRLVKRPKRLESPPSWIGHIPFAFYFAPLLNPEVIVELGTHSGNSFFAFCQAAKQNNLTTKCYAIDTWKGDKHSGYYYEDVYKSILEHQQKYHYDNAVLLRMTFDEALPNFQNKSIDLLHIDGLHTYEAVKHDFESWLPKLSEKAVVLFHDTQIKMKDFGVWKFWKEIRKNYPSFEFYHSCGLGILLVGGNVPANVSLFIKEAGISNRHRIFFEKESRWVLNAYNRLQFRRTIKSIFKRIFD